MNVLKHPNTRRPKYPSKRIRYALFLWVLGSLGAWVFPASADWPQWRGPTGDGVAAERRLPIIWNERRNLRWKCPLPAWGTSTPAIWGEAIFVTAHTDDDKLLALRIDQRTGEVVWQTEVATAKPLRRSEKPKRGEQTFPPWRNYAHPSPTTDGNTVAVYFGDGTLAGLGFDGKVIWKRNLADDHGPLTKAWGEAASPVLHRGLVISACVQDSLADLGNAKRESFVVAHDIRDGFPKWKTPRPTTAVGEQGDANTTPLVAKVNDASQLIVMGGGQLDGYDPATGKRLWQLAAPGSGSVASNPIVSNGAVCVTRGGRGPMFALKLRDAEKFTFRDVLWTYTANTPESTSPVLWYNLLFFVSDDGYARCLDAEHGTLHWKERLRGTYRASPIACEGRIFFLNTTGLCTVVSAAQVFDRLAENQLDDETFASPAASGGCIFIRGRKWLYCIGQQQE